MALSQIMWPVDLPQSPLADGYQRTIGRDVITSEFDVGMKRQRKRSSAAMTTVSATYFLKITGTKNSKKIFEDFEKIAEGRSFWWPDPEDDLKYKYARFAEAPVLKPMTGAIHWEVELKLEIWPYIEKGTETTNG